MFGGIEYGSDPLAQVIFDASYQQWVTLDGVKQVYLYRDEGSKALLTDIGRKKRYDYWTGYVYAMRRNTPDTVKLVVVSCTVSYCAINVDWAAYPLNK